MSELFLGIFWTVLGPIFLLIGLGAWLGRSARLDLDTLTRINLYAFVPALAFSKFVDSELSMQQVGMVALFCALYTLALWLMALALGRLIRLPEKSRATLQVVSMSPNTGNFGIPVAELAFGPYGVAVQAVVLLCQNLIFFTFATFLTAGGFGKGRRALKGMLGLPILYALGLALMLKGQSQLLPQPLLKAVHYLGAGLVPVALLTLGAQLGAQKSRSFGAAAAGATCLKLVLSPLVAWALVRAMGFDPAVGRVLIVASAAPSAVNSVLLALQFKKDPALASTAVFWTTLLSAFSVTAVVAMALPN